jgi:hypothetical protein
MGGIKIQEALQKGDLQQYFAPLDDKEPAHEVTPL